MKNHGSRYLLAIAFLGLAALAYAQTKGVVPVPTPKKDNQGSAKGINSNGDIEEEGPFSQALETRDWKELDRTMKDNSRHGMIDQKGLNPVAATPDSLAKGKSLYGEYCAICHGEAGKGDGVAAEHLTIKPANLQDIAKRFPDQLFFLQISKGKGDMPSWYDMLGMDEIWHVTNYIRSLAAK